MWLWERLWRENPRCVERFAEGLDYHWRESVPGEPDEYSRHAPVMAVAHNQRMALGSRDFPRHSGFLAAPHDLAKGVFALASDRATNALKVAMLVWGSRYGLLPVAYVATMCLCAFRHTRDERLLAWAAAACRAYAAEPFPQDVAVPAMDAGLAVELLANLYDLTGQPDWLAAGQRLAQKLVDVYWGDDAAIPRDAAGVDYYESQMGPGFLLHGLTRLALLARGDENAALAPDYTAR